MHVKDFMLSVAAGTTMGRVPWTMEDSLSFVAFGNQGAIRVRTSEGTMVPVEFQILNAAGDVLEEVRTEPDRPGPWHPWEQSLNALYQDARRHALGVTDVVADLTDQFGLEPPQALPSDDDVPF
jgi:hypothetical protein